MEYETQTPGSAQTTLRVEGRSNEDGGGGETLNDKIVQSNSNTNDDDKNSSDQNVSTELDDDEDNCEGDDQSNTYIKSSSHNDNIAKLNAALLSRARPTMSARNRAALSSTSVTSILHNNSVQHDDNDNKSGRVCVAMNSSSSSSSSSTNNGCTIMRYDTTKNIVNKNSLPYEVRQILSHNAPPRSFHLLGTLFLNLDTHHPVMEGTWWRNTTKRPDQKFELICTSIIKEVDSFAELPTEGKFRGYLYGIVSTIPEEDVKICFNKNNTNEYNITGEGINSHYGSFHLQGTAASTEEDGSYTLEMIKWYDVKPHLSSLEHATRTRCTYSTPLSDPPSATVHQNNKSSDSIIEKSIPRKRKKRGTAGIEPI
jgi:hypothetical protein